MEEEDQSTPILSDRLAFLLSGNNNESILDSYMSKVGNHESMLVYRHPDHFQWSIKNGESLYTHVLNGIFLLDTLRSSFGIGDVEAKVLFTAYTVHDINKMMSKDQKIPFNKLATEENVSSEIIRLGLPNFFPDWLDYIKDIIELVKGHNAHLHSSGNLFFVKHKDQYTLGLERVIALIHLIRAVDAIDLSKTLGEEKKKKDFISLINAYLSDSDAGYQHTLFTHRLSEQRGLLTNIFHEILTNQLSDKFQMIPISYYPNGVVYLARKDSVPTLGSSDKREVGKGVAETVGDIARRDYREFIKIKSSGIVVSEKCVELGVPFAGANGIWDEVKNEVYRRNLKHSVIEAGVRDKAEKKFETNREKFPNAADLVRNTLDDDTPITPQSIDDLRSAEFIRSYQIFLKHYEKQLKRTGKTTWEHVYQLFEVSDDRQEYYNYFDPRFSRAYVLMNDISKSEEEIYEFLERDGTKMSNSYGEVEDPRVPIFQNYAEQFISFSGAQHEGVDFKAHLRNYIKKPNKQCSVCGSMFPTKPWRKSNVRNDVGVRSFSNRTVGGAGEPEKQVCLVCETQFLLERLNYPLLPSRKGAKKEKLFYLHFFPYSFVTEPFLKRLRSTFQTLIDEARSIEALELQALNMDAMEAFDYWTDRGGTPETIYQQKKWGKASERGFYIPRYSQTVSNVLTFPINADGKNHTEKFLFCLWNLMVLQRHFGMKGVLSSSPIPFVEQESISDLTIENTPVALQGLLPQNRYNHFIPNARGKDDTGALKVLWDKVGYLFDIHKLVATGKNVNGSDEIMVRLIRALSDNPLEIFHQVDLLIQSKTKQAKNPSRSSVWILGQVSTPTKELSILVGGQFMKKLHDLIGQSAELARSSWLKGDSFERSSISHPLDEVFNHIEKLHLSEFLDLETVKAAAGQEIFDHLDRLGKNKGFSMGGTKRAACTEFVDIWFDDILEGVYKGDTREFLSEKSSLLAAYRSAFWKSFNKNKKSKNADKGKNDEEN